MAHAGPLSAGLSSSPNSLTQQAPKASHEEGKGGYDRYPCSPSSRDAVMLLVLLWPGELEYGRAVPGWAGGGAGATRATCHPIGPVLLQDASPFCA